MKLEFSCQIFEKYSNIKFHENSSFSMQEDEQTDRQTDMSKLIAAFRSFANEHRQEVRLQNRYVIYCGISCRKAIRIRTAHRRLRLEPRAVAVKLLHGMNQSSASRVLASHRRAA